MARVGARHDTAAVRPTSYGSLVAGVRIVDADLARRLVLHEARAQQTPARTLRDLGDGWLFHDANDAEPFWNRLIAPSWPAGARGFDRRLDEVTTLFATIDRLPHIRPLPVGCEPPDLALRLQRAGFDIVGADLRMTLVDPRAALAPSARGLAAATAALGATVESSRHGIRADRGRIEQDGVERRREGVEERLGERTRWGERRRWASDASLVLTEAFGVEPERRIALENDVMACVSRSGCSILLLRVDGEPAAIARRASTPEGSYLSSIGTRPRFRRHGLGALATSLLVADAVEEGSELVHLAVEAINEPARRLYERLGFAVVGEPALDLLLR
jgi:ribosomal protein S18 acetylase RimI-like enzyme